MHRLSSQNRPLGRQRSSSSHSQQKSQSPPFQQPHDASMSGLSASHVVLLGSEPTGPHPTSGPTTGPTPSNTPVALDANGPQAFTFGPGLELHSTDWQGVASGPETHRSLHQTALQWAAPGVPDPVMDAFSTASHAPGCFGLPPALYDDALFHDFPPAKLSTANAQMPCVYDLGSGMCGFAAMGNGLNGVGRTDPTSQVQTAQPSGDSGFLPTAPAAHLSGFPGGNYGPILSDVVDASLPMQFMTPNALAVDLGAGPQVSSNSVFLPSPPYTTSGYVESTHLMPGQQDKKRKRQTTSEAEAVKRIREIGACLRCKTYRKQCSDDEVCSACAAVIDTRRCFNQPCVRVLLKDVQPFRLGNSRLGQIKSTLPTFRWDHQEPKSRLIMISPLFTTVSSRGTPLPSLEVRCRKFLPADGDVLEEAYETVDGEVTIVKFPPYACLDAGTKKMQTHMDNYLDVCRGFAEAEIDRSVEDDIIRLCLAEARRFSRTRATVLSEALKIQAAAFISEIQPVITGQETLGIPRITNSKYSQSGKVLIPISLDYQLDNLYIVYMKKCLKHVHRGLTNLIFKNRNRKKSWYEIFLIMFVLLSTLENVHASQLAFVRKYHPNEPNFLAHTNATKRHMIEEWRQSAKNLIYHFRVIVRGMLPFSQTWTREKQEEAGLDDEAIAFLKEMSFVIANRRDEIYHLSCMDLNNDATQPLVWLSHLFVDD